MTSRSAKTTEEMAHDLTDRLMALGRAHDLVRLIFRPEKKAALLGDLIAVILEPYVEMETPAERIRISVPKMAVGEETAMALALVMHELATNSLKYGALAVARGTLDVSCSVHVDEVVVIWTERGGSPVVTLSKSSGFGSKMVNRTMSRQLGGSIGFDWSKEGVIITLRMNKLRLGT